MHTAARLAAAGLAITLSACSGTTMVVTPMSSSTMPPVTASIAPALDTAAAFTGHACLVGSRITSPFDIVVVAANTVNMDRLTLQLIDGSRVGGPTITFPQAELSNQFGTTLIVAGTTRVFRLQPTVTCGATPWWSASAELAFRDPGGAMHIVTAQTRLR